MEIKIITKEQAEKLGLTKPNKYGGGKANFFLTATGKIGNKEPETVTIHNPETGEKQILFDKGKRFEFKGFKIKKSEDK